MSHVVARSEVPLPVSVSERAPGVSRRCAGVAG